MTAIINWLQEHWLAYLPLILAVVGVARAIVILTPSQNDDGWLAKIIVWLSYIGLHIPDDRAAGLARSKHAIANTKAKKAAAKVREEHAETVANKKLLNKSAK